MRVFTITSLVALVSLVTGAEVQKLTPPPLTTANGFRLMVHVVKGPTYIRGACEGQYLQIVGDRYKPGIRRLQLDGTRAGRLNPNPNKVFYVNGTKEDVAKGTTTLVLDDFRYLDPNNETATRQAPYSVFFAGPDNSQTGGVNITLSKGTKGIRLSPATDAFSYLVPDQWLPFWQSKAHIGYNILGNAATHVPDPQETKIVIRLIPQCASLDHLTEDSESNHDFAQPVRCYDSPQDIDWFLYDKHC